MPKETERLDRQNKLKDRLSSVVDRVDTLLDDEDEAMAIVTATSWRRGAILIWGRRWAKKLAGADETKVERRDHKEYSV